jgi:putative flavoprotein involved in K+ transport
MIAMIKRAVRTRSGNVDVVVIGAGHSGLAMSRCLTARSINHVVLERGEVANSWRHERWDSLRLLTPNWMSRLPGYGYQGDDPDGYMTMQDVIGFISGYAAVSSAPVRTGTTVMSVEPGPDGYRVITDQGEYRCRAVVVASGAFNVPLVPAIGKTVPHDITQLTARQYRNPKQLKAGGVLVVGASATGLQLADEIQRAGHPVTMAVGEHVRLPRVYRGRDIQWWMHAAGVLDEHYDTVDDIVRARGVPSPQLIGSGERSTLDLNTLTSNGVRLAGRLVGIRGGKAQFSGSLRNVCALADLKMDRLLRAIDGWAHGNGYDNEVGPAEKFDPTNVEKSACLNVGLTNGEIRTIVWATGFRPDYSWLNVPVLDRKGQIVHDGGVADAPGLYVMGLPFLRRRKSSFIHGAEDDARDLSEHLAAYLDVLVRRQLAGFAA